MINRYLAPCRYCGGTVPPDSGMVEKVGKSWQVAHTNCVETNRSDDLISMQSFNTVSTTNRIPACLLRQHKNTG